MIGLHCKPNGKTQESLLNTAGSSFFLYSKETHEKLKPIIISIIFLFMNVYHTFIQYLHHVYIYIKTHQTYIHPEVYMYNLYHVYKIYTLYTNKYYNYLFQAKIYEILFCLLNRSKYRSCV